MSIRKLEMEFGPDHLICRVEFVGGGKATVVGIDAGGEAGMVWSVDANEAEEARMAEGLSKRCFSAVLDAITDDEVDEADSSNYGGTDGDEG